MADADVNAAVQRLLVLPRLPHDKMDDALVDIIVEDLRAKKKVQPSFGKTFWTFPKVDSDAWGGSYFKF